jgi:putative transposase
MVYNPDIHHRRSIRLVGYDYSRSGAYFITICTHHRECIFGEIVDRAMNYNELGNIALSHWHNLATHHPNIEIDESIVMPNHLHGIIIVHESSKPISEIIRGFKTFSARQINRSLDRKGCPLWQRNYYEHIIRNEDELNNIRQYILNNPTNWQEDKNNINP